MGVKSSLQSKHLAAGFSRMLKFLSISAITLLVAASPVCAQQRKPVVAIYEIQDNTSPAPDPRYQRQSGYGNRNQTRQGNDEASGTATQLSTQLQDMLAQAIVSTNKFVVIERSQLRILVGEQLKARSGLVTTNTPNQIGGFEGADFLIYGAINQASSQVNTFTQAVDNKNYGLSVLGSLLGGGGQAQPKQFTQSCRYQLVTLSLNISIVDARSARVRYSSPVDQQGITWTDCPNAKPDTLTDIYRKTAQQLAFKLVTAIYPMKVASSLPDSTLIINYGEGFLKPEDLVTVYSKGATIRDPETGEVIGNDEIKVGIAQVTEVTAKFSKAKPIYGYGDTPTILTFVTPPSVGSIVRMSSEQELQPVAVALKKYQADLQKAQKKKR
jgi:curli biogenesis system outer membrane secretion channel CsgG